jgi:hypothetical protein
MKPTFKRVYRPYGMISLQDSIEGMRKLLLAAAMSALAYSADVCPAPGTAGEGSTDGQWSWAGRVGKLYCVGSEVRGRPVAVEWPASGIVRAVVEGRVEMAVCCFDSEISKPAQVRRGDDEFYMVPTHQEGHDSNGGDDDFPDLIEDEAHAKTVSIRGDLYDGERPVRVDVLLKCSASKFASQYAFQFTVINRSVDPVEIDWDHLRQMRAKGAPSVQNVAGGTAYVFLTAKRPHEAGATVELKTKSGKLLGRFRFDGFVD